MARGSAAPSPQYLGVPRIRRAMFRLFQGPSKGLRAGKSRSPAALARAPWPCQRPAYCGKPPEGAAEEVSTGQVNGMKSTAQVPCTCALPAMPPTALVKRTNFAQALDHVPAAGVQLVGSTDKQHVLNNWRPALPPFPGGFCYLICRLEGWLPLPARISRSSRSAAHVAAAIACISGDGEPTLRPSPIISHAREARRLKPTSPRSIPTKIHSKPGSPNSSPFTLRLPFIQNLPSAQRDPAGQAARPIVLSTLSERVCRRSAKYRIHRKSHA
jgi:hypothetical protein